METKTQLAKLESTSATPTPVTAGNSTVPKATCISKVPSNGGIAKFSHRREVTDR